MKHQLVYVGYCKLEGGKPGAVLRYVADDGTLGVDLIFDRKALSGASIGSVYEVEQVSETSWQIRSRVFVGRYPDNELVAQWQLAAKAAQVVEDSARAERAAAKELPAAFAHMEPLRKIYRSQLPNGKRAIEVLLLEYLRRGM